MKQGTVVIGANYGDEGKGLITDFETRRTSASVVCRFNGGAQAGHTVTTDSARHVFGHIGSGSFAGAATWLGSKFIMNPFTLGTELQKLQASGASPRVFAHSATRVSTLYDMALNSLAELKRGAARHGSCGLGINETVTRHLQHPITYHMLQTSSYESLTQQLQIIRTQWVPERLRALGIDEIAEPFKSIFENDDLSVMLTTMLNAPAKWVATPWTGTKPMPSASTVFEGAQGLALDEYLGAFPNVTRSITGLPYAIAAAHDLGIDTLQPVYVTRAYLTRHGAGVLLNEGVEFGAVNIVDTTNVHNQWQGTIRYAPLHLSMLKHYISQDLARGTEVARALGVSLKPATIALTCLDQLGPTVTVVDLDLSFKTVPTCELASFLTKRLGNYVSHISTGPKASDVEYFEHGV